LVVSWALPTWTASGYQGGINGVISSTQGALFDSYNSSRLCVQQFLQGTVVIVKQLVYANMTGNSMAAPHVTGAVALLKAACPWATPTQIVKAITENVDRFPGLEKLCSSGGRLNINKAIRALRNSRAGAVEIPTPPVVRDGGNGDGYFASGEPVMVTTAVRNVGSATAIGVRVRLSVSATSPDIRGKEDILVTGSDVVLGDLMPGSEIANVALQATLTETRAGVVTVYPWILSGAAPYVYQTGVPVQVVVPWIDGQVTNVTTKAPVSGANVRIDTSAWTSVTTSGADGRYRLPLRSFGNFNLSVSAPGYAQQRILNVVTPASASVDAQLVRVGLTVASQPLAFRSFPGDGRGDTASFAITNASDQPGSWNFDRIITSSTAIIISLGATSGTVNAANGVTPSSSSISVTVKALSSAALGSYIARIRLRSADALLEVPVLVEVVEAVSVTAPDAYAHERGGDKGVFRISRDAVRKTPLTVSYVLSGTALNGRDIVVGTGVVVIPAGKAEAELPVQVIDDRAPEGIETALISLPATTAYLFTGATSATMIVLDDDLPSVTTPWSSLDIGAVNTAGYSQTLPNGSIAITGSGLIAENTASPDAFRFAYQTLTGNGVIIGRLDAFDVLKRGSSALVARLGTSSTAPQVVILVTPDGNNGVTLQMLTRSVPGGVNKPLYSKPKVFKALPLWLKLERTNNWVKAL